jgi:sulfur-oxidizing protein SoxY
MARSRSPGFVEGFTVCGELGHHDMTMQDEQQPFGFTRRSVSLALAGAALAWLTGPAAAGEEELSPAVQALIAAFARGKPPVDEGLTVDMDDSVDDGSSVPVVLSVESPMTAADHIEAMLLLAPLNPFLTVAEFRFTPLSGRAMVRTRMRLAKSQTVLALARTSTGDVYLARRRIEVVANGCVG